MLACPRRSCPGSSGMGGQRGRWTPPATAPPPVCRPDGKFAGCGKSGRRQGSARSHRRGSTFIVYKILNPPHYFITSPALWNEAQRIPGPSESRPWTGDTGAADSSGSLFPLPGGWKRAEILFKEIKGFSTRMGETSSNIFAQVLIQT